MGAPDLRGPVPPGASFHSFKPHGGIIIMPFLTKSPDREVKKKRGERFLFSPALVLGYVMDFGAMWLTQPLTSLPQMLNFLTATWQKGLY